MGRAAATTSTRLGAVAPARGQGRLYHKVDPYNDDREFVVRLVGVLDRKEVEEVTPAPPPAVVPGTPVAPEAPPPAPAPAPAPAVVPVAPVVTPLLLPSQQCPTRDSTVPSRTCPPLVPEEERRLATSRRASSTAMLSLRPQIKLAQRKSARTRWTASGRTVFFKAATSHLFVAMCSQTACARRRRPPSTRVQKAPTAPLWTLDKFKYTLQSDGVVSGTLTSKVTIAQPSCDGSGKPELSGIEIEIFDLKKYSFNPSLKITAEKVDLKGKPDVSMYSGQVTMDNTQPGSDGVAEDNIVGGFFSASSEPFEDIFNSSDMQKVKGAITSFIANQAYDDEIDTLVENRAEYITDGAKYCLDQWSKFFQGATIQ